MCPTWQEVEHSIYVTVTARTTKRVGVTDAMLAELKAMLQKQDAICEPSQRHEGADGGGYGGGGAGGGGGGSRPRGLAAQASKGELAPLHFVGAVDKEIMMVEATLGLGGPGGEEGYHGDAPTLRMSQRHRSRNAKDFLGGKELIMATPALQALLREKKDEMDAQLKLRDNAPPSALSRPARAVRRGGSYYKYYSAQLRQASGSSEGPQRPVTCCSDRSQCPLILCATRARPVARPRDRC